MGSVISRDGTSIAYERLGAGPPLVLVDGALCYRASGPMRELARHLAGHFTVYLYDRRGRGESGDAPAWTPEREVEDLAAVLEAAGGSAMLFGISSGAALALDAARRLEVPRVAVYEPPFFLDGARAPLPAGFVEGLRASLAAGRPGDAVKQFMRLVGMPGLLVALFPALPGWSRLTAVAHTLPYDFGLLDGTQHGGPLPRERWAGVSQPALVLAGGKSPAWMQHGADALAAALPAARHRTLPGQTHMVKAGVLAPALVEFLAERRAS